MLHSLRRFLVLSFLAVIAIQQPVLAQVQVDDELIRRLRDGLNSSDFAELNDLFE